jgi:hypothetical protein
MLALMSNQMKHRLIWSSALTVACGLIIYLMFAFYERAPPSW